MFKITCFAPIDPSDLEQRLKGIYFKTVRKGFEWSMDGSTFRIEPFENQPRTSMKAYRISFDGEIHGGQYLFDLTIGCLEPLVTCVECILDYPTMKDVDWMKELRKRPSYQMIDPRGLYMKKGISAIVTNDSLTLKLHSRKNNNLKLVDALKEIDILREDLVPNEDCNLFSCLQEEIA
ncbi:hypothetical protein ACFFHF_17040 [Robertmurraya beringensis]|uniref:Uncharacterized protein n=1 Tax=Robertmurraya beringensis TaxID=641660 RepID=A0ABV6KY43_9BACI